MGAGAAMTTACFLVRAKRHPSRMSDPHATTASPAVVPSGGGEVVREGVREMWRKGEWNERGRLQCAHCGVLGQPEDPALWWCEDCAFLYCRTHRDSHAHECADRNHDGDGDDG